MPKDPCKDFACRIQKCLMENKFQESACAAEIEALRKCCEIWAAESICCSGIDVGEKKADPNSEKNPCKSGCEKDEK